VKKFLLILCISVIFISPVLAASPRQTKSAKKVPQKPPPVVDVCQQDNSINSVYPAVKSHQEHIRSINQEIFMLNSWEIERAEQIAKEKGADFSPKGEFENITDYEKRAKISESLLAEAKNEASAIRTSKEKELKIILSSLEKKEFCVPFEARYIDYNTEYYSDGKEVLMIIGNIGEPEWETRFGAELSEFKIVFNIPPEDVAILVRNWQSVKFQTNITVLKDTIKVSSLKLLFDNNSWTSRTGWLYSNNKHKGMYEIHYSNDIKSYSFPAHDELEKWIEKIIYRNTHSKDQNIDVSLKMAIEGWEKYLKAFPDGEHALEAKENLVVWRDRQKRKLEYFQGEWITAKERKNREKEQENFCYNTCKITKAYANCMDSGIGRGIYAHCRDQEISNKYRKVLASCFGAIERYGMIERYGENTHIYILRKYCR